MTDDASERRYRDIADNDLRRARIRHVIRDFFKDKPPGTTIEDHELDAYRRRLREAAGIKIGAAVRVAHQPDKDHRYLKETHAMRQAGDGLTGVTIAEHDFHGLCYDVKFPSTTAVITYDRDELEVLLSERDKTPARDL